MERLTKVIAAYGKNVVVYTRGKYEDTTAGEMEVKDVRNVMGKLSDYENTGLAPEQIRELKERDTAITAIITGYNRAIGCKVGECPKCGTMTRDYLTFCGECGQRIKWEDRT